MSPVKPKSNIVPPAELTREQVDSRVAFAMRTNQAEDRYDVVREAEPGQWYDFVDLETAAFGQCRRAPDGTWQQAPVGKNPVLLAWKGNAK